MISVILGLAVAAPSASAQQPLYTPGQDFTPTSRLVATSVFHWFTSSSGQTVGPWLPEEGRGSWTGEPAFWQHQIKDMMDANIDCLYVHLWRGMETQRINLFKALSQLRAEGYAVPKVAPFLDTMITWEADPLDLATMAGKDEFVGEYIRFFNQYFDENTDAHAESYLAHIAGKVILNTWHLSSRFIFNKDSLTRSDVESRLAAALGGSHPTFTKGVYMIGSGNPCTWFDETAYQFAGTSYYLNTMNYNGRKTATLRGGYWDELIRDPYRFVPREGGVHFIDAWACLNSIKAGGQVNCSAFPDVQESDAFPIYHALIESWNEYAEGTGIFAANPAGPVIPPSGHTDVWSSTNKPREYIDTAASGAAQFNDTPQYEATFLRHNFPAFMRSGETATATVIVRNEGDAQWTAASGCKLGQWPSDPGIFGSGGCLIDDGDDEIPKYGGIFRGRPKTFLVQLAAPHAPGVYQAHWQMLHDSVQWFGQPRTVTIRVVATGDFDFDDDVDQDDFGHLQACLGGTGVAIPQGCEDADLNRDHEVDQQDFTVFQSCLSGPNQPSACAG